MIAKKGDVVIITWIDAWSNSHARFDQNYTYKSILMQNIGFLVQENEWGLTTCVKQQNYGDSYDGETFIPWEMIVEWEVLV